MKKICSMILAIFALCLLLSPSTQAALTFGREKLKGTSRTQGDFNLQNRDSSVNPASLTTDASTLNGNRSLKNNVSTIPLSADVVACVQTAVDTRDTAIIAAVNAYTTAVMTALSTRKDALKAAWAIPAAKDMKAALKTAWTNYGVAAKAARKALSDAKKSAWTAFAAARKACKAPASIESGATSGVDANL
jgi:hypothetical protein